MAEPQTTQEAAEEPAADFTAVGCVGEKCGMSRVFTKTGASIPVTVVRVLKNRICALRYKEDENKSLGAVRVAWGQAGRHISKAEQGVYKSAGVEAARGSTEIQVKGDTAGLELGTALKASQFDEGNKVDVTGVSKGKGFAGAVKRWNFSMQDATHGNSLAHRAPGSIGQCQTPGRVWKGKKMAGHMGHERVTVQNLEIASVDAERDLLFIKGAVPGPVGSMVLVKPAVKVRDK